MSHAAAVEDLVALLHLQSLAFLLAWGAAFVAGHRLKRGHWLVTLLFIALLEWGAARLVLVLGGTLPSFTSLAILGGLILLVVATTDDWNALGQAAMSATWSLSLLFLTYIVYITSTSHLGWVSLFFSFILFVLQAMALLLLVASSYEILDVMTRIRWRRVKHPGAAAGYAPRVSVHVPAYNEPPQMVIETLDALARLDYPNYEVIVIDDNTTDPGLWRPVEEHCQELGFRFFHLENWPGFKSGALNFALKETDPKAEIIAVVDSDYIVAPDWLNACVGFFSDPEVAFVQCPQDYRDVLPDDRYATACYYAYQYFFKISMASRNEHNGIIFAGTMGLLRRSTLERAGGWDEWCITEDAELSVRLLDLGYKGLYVDRAFGHGLMPLNFEGLKKQRFRWAFGGMQILRMHWKRFLPGRRASDSRLTRKQRMDYLLGGLQWLNDPVTFSFTMLLLMGTGSLLVAHSLFIQPLAGAVMVIPFLFVFIGVSRFLWALRHRVGCNIVQAGASFTILLALTWVVTMACVLGLVKEKGVFLRTPKRRQVEDRWQPFRVVVQETALAFICFAAASLLCLRLPYAKYGWLMVGLLLWQGIIYSSAFRATAWSVASEARLVHPEYLEASRTTGRRSTSMITERRPLRWILTASAATALLFLLAIKLAPEEERAFRANPNQTPMIGGELTQASPEAQVKSIVYLEGKAALDADTAAALRLWDRAGVIRDAHYTLADSTDDRVWRGHDAIRERYRDEFGQRRYLELSHSDASVIIEGNTATLVNDLRAKILTPNGVQSVFLSKGDRWELKREDGTWRITQLVVNRTPR
jgi:cellulose synthase/poly-beta-1,6-N-acetylglucosamine synthase-like glycosyltransferase